LFFQLRLAVAESGYFGVGKRDPGHVLVVQFFLQRRKKVVQQQCGVLLGGVGELERTGHVPAHVHVLIGGLQVTVRFNAAPFGLDFALGQIQFFPVLNGE